MADVEALLVGWLHSTLGVRFVTDTPANLADVLPLGRVLRVGGPSADDNPRFDMPTVTIDAFAADRAAAIALAANIDESLREVLPGQKIDGLTVTRVQTVTGPSWRPWDDTTLRRVGATYRLYLKG